MVSRDRFQLYLLSKMSASNLVAEALDDLGSSREEMVVVASVLAADFGLDEVSHPADVYTTLIGEPEEERTLTSAETGEEFAGSRQRVYALPLWPAVVLTVNRHPEGYAWGVGFEPHESVPDAGGLALAERARPWQTAAAPVLAGATTVEVIEEWSDSLEALFEFREDGRRATWQGRFDLRLLQWWRRRA